MTGTTRINPRNKQRASCPSLLLWVVAVLSTPLFCSVAQVVEIPSVLPYDGALDIDGISSNGPIDMRFSLFAEPSGGAPVWTEDWTAALGRPVLLAGGRFHVPLGQSDADAMRTVLRRAGRLYLSLSVKHPDDETFIALEGRQPLEAVGHALWAMQAEDLEVNDLLVQGSATIGGHLAVTGEMTAQGALTVGSTQLDEARGALRADTGNFGTVQGATLAGQAATSVITPSAIVATGLTLSAPNRTISSGSVRSSNGRTLRLYGADVGAAPGRAIVHNHGDALIFGFDPKPNNYLGWDRGALQLGSPGSNFALSILGDLVVRGATTMNYWGVGNNDPAVSANAIVLGGTTTTTHPSVSSGVFASHCRICLNYGGDSNIRRHSCVSLNGTQRPGRFNTTGLVDGNDTFELTYLCDNGGNSSGIGWVTP